MPVMFPFCIFQVASAMSQKSLDNHQLESPPAVAPWTHVARYRYCLQHHVIQCNKAGAYRWFMHAHACRPRSSPSPSC